MLFSSVASRSAALPKGAGAAVRNHLLLALVWVALLAALVSYWTLLLASHQAQLHNVQMQTRQRAAQTAHALSLQVGTLFKTIDYVSSNLGDLWLNGDAAVVQQAIGVAQKVLPRGALTQVAVANVQGEIIFSSLAGQGSLSEAEARYVSVADRAYFQAHLRGEAPHLFISQPLLERLSHKWTVQFSAPLRRGETLLGVLILSVPAEYLSRALSDVFPNAADVQDVAILLMNDGSYLARSHGLGSVLGKIVPDSWEFLHLPRQDSGAYEAAPPVDGIQRYYAWHRAADYPVLLTVGLGKHKALAEVTRLVRQSRWNNALGTLLVLLAAAWISHLWRKQRAQAAALAISSERFELALRGGDLGSWDYHCDTRLVDCSQRWAAMFGYGQQALAFDFSALGASLHPQDKEQVQAALRAHFKGQTEQYEARYRRRHSNGDWVWVLDRGRVVEHRRDGRALRMVGTTLDITAQKLAEAAEQAYHERITKLMAQVPGVVYQYLRRADKTDCFPYASPGLLTLFGVAPQEALLSAHKVFARIHPADIERIGESGCAAQLQTTGWRAEFRVLQEDGSVRWVLAQARLERVEQGALHWYGYAHDITAEHEAAEKLKHSEAHLRSTLQAVRDGLWGWDVNTGKLQWDARISEMLGYDQPFPDMHYAQWTDMLHPSDRERAEKEWQAYLSDYRGQVAAVQYRLRTARGDWLWVEARGRVVGWGEDGLPARVIGTLSDISSSVAESQLRRAVLDQSTAAIAMFTPDSRLVYANERALEIFAELDIAPDVRSQVPVAFSAAHLDSLAPYLHTLRTQGEVRFEYQMRTRRGQVRWFDVHAVLRDPEDMGSDGVWTLIDISQKNASEEALATEHLRLTTLLHRFPGGVLMQDAGAVVAMINQNMCDFFDLAESPASLQGMHHSQLCRRLGELRAAWLHVPSDPLESEKRRTTEVHSPSGRILEINWVPITRNGQELGRVWLVDDISERRQREEALATLAATDMLTGLPNRRSFMAALDAALLDARGHTGQRGILLMADIDHFKRVNDTYGHLVGDAVLQHVGQVMRQELRQHDSAGRIGGEEFTVLLHRIGLDDGLALANRIRQSLADTPVMTSAGSIAVTISIGLVVLEGGDATRALSRADEALYAAKGSGRNRVCVWQADTCALATVSGLEP